MFSLGSDALARANAFTGFLHIADKHPPIRFLRVNTLLQVVGSKVSRLEESFKIVYFRCVWCTETQTGQNEDSFHKLAW